MLYSFYNGKIKIMTKIPLYLTTCCIFFAASLTAQVKIGNNPAAINGNSILELESTNKGLLLPRVALILTTLANPLSSHITGMTVYNTATVNDVTNGYYYNDGTKWIKVAGATTGTPWSTTGNAGTVSGTNFLGTTDNVPLNFRVNNSNAGKIDFTLSNVALGVYSLQNNSTGSTNTAIGHASMFTNTTGSNNAALGYGSLYGNTTGTQNLAIGTGALFSNNIGNSNTATGFGALYTNISGSQNTSLGFGALYSNTIASGNVGIGSGALYSNTTGANNTALGNNAGNVAGGFTGSNNILIGFNAQPSSTSISNEVTIGSASNNVYRMYAAAWTNASDLRLKHNIQMLPIGLNFVMGLKPVEYVYNNVNKETKSLGFIAQDVLDNLKQNNMDKGYGLVSNLDEKYLGLNTTELIPVLTKAIQEQQTQIKTQGDIINNQQKQIDELIIMMKQLLNK
jgi:trimeric autotransporter adhesin